MKKLSLIFSILLLSLSVQASDYILKPELKLDTVLFESDAKLEFIAGKTNTISGSFSFDIDNPQDSVYGILKVDLTTLRTQIATRDKDMKKEYLETDKYPFAYFELTSISHMPKSLKNDSTYTFEGDGYFYMHGVKNRLKPKLKIRVPSGEKNQKIDLTAEFFVLLEDYNIERPQLVILKVARQINLKIKFSAYQVERVEKIKIPSIFK